MRSKTAIAISCGLITASVTAAFCQSPAFSQNAEVSKVVLAKECLTVENEPVFENLDWYEAQRFYQLTASSVGDASVDEQLKSVVQKIGSSTVRNFLNYEIAIIQKNIVFGDFYFRRFSENHLTDTVLPNGCQVTVAADYRRLFSFEANERFIFLPRQVSEALKQKLFSSVDEKSEFQAMEMIVASFDAKQRNDLRHQFRAAKVLSDPSQKKNLIAAILHAAIARLNERAGVQMGPVMVRRLTGLSLSAEVKGDHLILQQWADRVVRGLRETD